MQHRRFVVEGPTHTNLIFDVVVPNEVKTSEAELKVRMEDILRELGIFFCDHDRQGLCKITKSEERERKNADQCNRCS